MANAAQSRKKTASLSIRIDPETKASVEELYASFGITVSDAVSMFFHKSLMEGGLPFSLRQPRYNEETEEAMREARDIASGKVEARGYASAKELLDEIEGRC